MSLEALRTPSDNQPARCPPWSAEHESNLIRTHDSYATPLDATHSPLDPSDLPDSSGFELEGSARGFTMLSLSKFLTCRLACLGVAGPKHLIRVD
jgi:hypothetical protein